MKKVILLATIALVIVAMASTAFAEATFNGVIGATAAVSTQIGGAVYVPSTGVYVSVAAITTAYCVSAVHNSSLGNSAGQEYASTSVEATIKSKSAAGISAIDACPDPTAGQAPQFPSGF